MDRFSQNFRIIFFAKFLHFMYRENFAFFHEIVRSEISRKFSHFSRAKEMPKKMRNFRRIFFAKRFSIFVGNPRPDKFDFLMLVHKIILEERRGQKFLPVMSHNFTICCCLVCILKIQRVEILCRKPRI